MEASMKSSANLSAIFKTAGYIGLLLLAGGYMRYSVQETMSTLNKALLISGGLLVLLSIIFNLANIRTYFGRRSSRLGANTAIMTIAVIAILGIVNFLAYRHHKRVDLTEEQLYSLSDQTRKIVSGLQEEVKILNFNKTDDQTLTDLMKEYKDLSKRVTYQRIDPHEKPELAREHNITRMGETVVISETRTERPQEISEQTLTNAILKVTREKLKTVCFVEGHGEKQISSMDAEGYGTVDKMLKDENYDTKTVNLVTANQVPPECAVLVLPGPKQALFPQEASMVGKYLDNGGKAFLMLDPDTDAKLGDVLKSWNIEVGNDTIVDVSGVGRLFGTGPAVPLASSYGSHAITKDFQGSMTFFPMARSVKASAAGGGDTTELLKTSEESWAETELKGDQVKLDEGKDQKGPISIGVAASKKNNDKESRLVVMGDSDFASNGYAQLQRNADLFMNTVNWLAQDEDLISIRAKDPTDRRVTLTESQQNFLKILLIFLMPAAVIGSGIFVWWNRR
jgi:ABC-type uncharacterized transport system involved in gliding motility auxiliary subunit